MYEFIFRVMERIKDWQFTFAPISTLNPRQTVKFRVDAKGKESGDARVIVEVSSDAIKTPIVQQESTIVN